MTRPLTFWVFIFGLSILWAEGGLARLPRLEPLGDPVLDGMDDKVQEELTNRRQRLEGLLNSPDTDPVELARELGDLGGLYFLYGLSAHADIALRNARLLDPENFRWPYLLAFRNQSEGQLDEAAVLFERTLELKPDYLAALIRLGNLRLDELQLEPARALFERALDLSQSTAAAHYGLGRIASESADAATAAKHFETVLRLQPGASAIHYPLAQAYRQLGRMDGAKAHLAMMGTQQVAIPDPVTRRLRGLATGSAVSFVRGQRALTAGQLDAAEDLFRSSKEADPESAPVRRALGLTLRRAGDFDGAIIEYKGAIELEPANPLNHQDLALALSDAGRYSEAEESFRRAIELEAEFLEAHVGLGIALARQGRPQDALAPLARALEMDPLKTSARFERAMALLQVGELSEARRELETLLQSEPGHLSARINLARLFELADELDEAERHCREALDQSPPSRSGAHLRLMLGRVAERRGDFASAGTEYERAVELDPDLAPIHLRLASIRARSASYVAAAESYGRLLELAPTHHTARLAQATSWILAGSFAQAKETLEKGLELDSENPALAAELAILLAGCPDEAVRDPDAALERARVAFRTFNDPFSGQILALALAAAGRFEEAERAQVRIIAAIEQAGAPVSGPSRSRLDQFRRGVAPRAPWVEDPLLLAPAVLPLRESPSR